MNLELYRIFYVVAECKNITKASDELNISQPAVTKHIKNLEEYLGTPLFIRTKKGVVLNECGEKIFLKVKQAITLLDDVERELTEFDENQSGTIKLGISTSLTREYLLKYVRDFHKMYPNIILTISTDPTKKLINELKSGKIDIIISKFPKNKDLELNYNKIGTTKYIFVVNEDYKFLLNKKIDATEIIKYPLLLQKNPSNSRSSADEYFKMLNLKVEPTMNIGSSNLLIDFVKIGYGIGYVTKMYAKNELDNKIIFELDMKEDTEYIDYGIITLKNNVLASSSNKLIDYLTHK